MYRKEIQEASKKPDFEVHRNYLDVQILLDGSEMWEYADRADLAVKTPYDPEADIEWHFRVWKQNSDETGNVLSGLSG